MLTRRTSGIVTAMLLALQVIILFWMGRIIIGEQGFGIWTWNAWSTNTSQLFGDPYSFSHVLHGIIFFAALWFLRKQLSLEWRILIATLIEVAWEIFENTPFIINRYRDATASLEYYGDSILNSVGDTIFMLLGLYIAMKLPWKWTLAIVVLIELIMLAIMRDNLTLNVLMLIYPIDAIRTWQMG